MALCIFCLRRREDAGETCTYGLGHEFPAEEKKAQPPKKADKQICSKCALHAKNPASQANGCQHEYPQ